MPMADKSIKTEGRLVVARGGFGGIAKEPGVSFWVYENVLKLWVSHICEYTKHHQIVHFKKLNCMLCEFSLNKAVKNRWKNILFLGWEWGSMVLGSITSTKNNNNDNSKEEKSYSLNTGKETIMMIYPGAVVYRWDFGKRQVLIPWICMAVKLWVISGYPLPDRVEPALKILTR